MPRNQVKKAFRSTSSGRHQDVATPAHESKSHTSGQASQHAKTDTSAHESKSHTRGQASQHAKTEPHAKAKQVEQGETNIKSKLLGCIDVEKSSKVYADCYEAMLWIRHDGFKSDYAKTYEKAGLSRHSSLKEFQRFLHDASKKGCPKPCDQEELLDTSSPQAMYRAYHAFSEAKKEQNSSWKEMAEAEGSLRTALSDLFETERAQHAAEAEENNFLANLRRKLSEKAAKTPPMVVQAPAQTTLPGASRPAPEVSAPIAAAAAPASTKAFRAAAISPSAVTPPAAPTAAAAPAPAQTTLPGASRPALGVSAPIAAAVAPVSNEPFRTVAVPPSAATPPAVQAPAQTTVPGASRPPLGVSAPTAATRVPVSKQSFRTAAVPPSAATPPAAPMAVAAAAPSTFQALPQTTPRVASGSVSAPTVVALAAAPAVALAAQAVAPTAATSPAAARATPATTNDTAQDPTALVFVFSDAGNAEQREAIRRAFRRGGLGRAFVLRFSLCGNPPSDSDESKGDLVVVSCTSSSGAPSTAKGTTEAMRIFDRNYGGRALLVLMEDDTFVAWRRLRLYLRGLAGVPTSGMYMAVAQDAGQPVNKMPLSASQLPENVYPSMSYPVHPEGSFVVLGRSIVRQILSSDVAERYPLHDRERAIGLWVDTLRRSGADVKYFSIPGLRKFGGAFDNSCERTWSNFPFLVQHGLVPSELTCLATLDVQGDPTRSIAPCFRACTKVGRT